MGSPWEKTVFSGDASVARTWRDAECVLFGCDFALPKNLAQRLSRPNESRMRSIARSMFSIEFA